MISIVRLDIFTVCSKLRKILVCILSQTLSHNDVRLKKLNAIKFWIRLRWSHIIRQEGHLEFQYFAWRLSFDWTLSAMFAVTLSKIYKPQDLPSFQVFSFRDRYVSAPSASFFFQFASLKKFKIGRVLKALTAASRILWLNFVTNMRTSSNLPDIGLSTSVHCLTPKWSKLLAPILKKGILLRMLLVVMVAAQWNKKESSKF